MQPISRDKYETLSLARADPSGTSPDATGGARDVKSF